MCAAALTLFAATPAWAQHYADGSLASFTSSLLYASGCPNLVVTHPVSGGNPGALLAFTQSECGTPEFATHYSPFTWDPSTQGALTTITVGWDARWTGGSFFGDTRIGTGFILRQSGHTYIGLGPGASFGEVATSSWSHFSAVLTQSMWCDYNGFSCNGTLPDFSTTGGVMAFGLETSNYCPGCGKTLSGELDNFSVDLQYTPPVTAAPEPASIALVACGLVGVGFVGRRRRAR
ncbi:MAG: PEP-CTERM sorting domain-containing protein [Gemmatimonadetes bacterium]|nr:PEP-CTERM sorting domain-containing protein [Gemmatimonadota bacterium]